MRRLQIQNLFIFALLLCISLLGCSDESLLGSDDNSISSRGIIGNTMNSGKLINISYDIDVTSRTMFDCHPSRFDMAAGRPTAEKQKLNFTLMIDGNVELITEKLESINKTPKTLTAPDNDLPQIMKTVLQNNTLRLYDQNGKLIRSLPNQAIKMPDVANKIKQVLSDKNFSKQEIYKFLTGIQTKVNIDELTKMIAKPPKEVTINQINNHVYAIRMPIPPDMTIPNAKSVVTMVNIHSKELLASRIYGSGDKVIQCTMYRYENGVLTGYKQELPVQMPDCNNAAMETYAKISNLTITPLI